MFNCLPPGRISVPGRCITGTPADYIGDHLARGRTDRAVARLHQHDQARPLHQGTLRRAGSGDGAGDGLPAMRFDLNRHQRRTLRGTETQRVDGKGFRTAGRRRHTRGHQGAGATAPYRRRARWHPYTFRRLRQRGRHNPGAGEGRTRRRRADLSERAGNGNPYRRRPGHRREHRLRRYGGRPRGALRRHVDTGPGRDHRGQRSAARLRALLRVV